jgi:hypothetical protein
VQSHVAASCEPLNIARNVPTKFADGASQPSRQEIIADEPRQRGRGPFRARRRVSLYRASSAHLRHAAETEAPPIIAGDKTTMRLVQPSRAASPEV